MGAASKIPFRDKQVPMGPTVVYSRIDNVTDGRKDGPCFFEIEVEITAAQLIAGAIVVLPDAYVPQGCKVSIRDYQFRWGAAAFTTATDVRLSDNNGTPVDFVTVAVANTTNAIHRLSATGVTQTGVTQGSALIGPADGGTVDKGLQIRSTGSAPAAGSTFRVYVRGYFVLV